MSVFTAKSTPWQNVPSTASPLDATGLNDLETRIANAFSAIFNYESVLTHGADLTGTADSTAAFNAALAIGSTIIPAGTYKILGTVTVPLEADFIGVGAGKVTLKLGASGQIAHGARTVDTSIIGGFTGGFKVDGQNLANLPGGAFYIGFCLKRKFADIFVTGSAGDNIVIETAQNCTFDTIQSADAARSCVVFDYGTGGHVFYNPEISNPGRHSIEFRQTGQSAGGYPTFLGPSGCQFFGGIAEYGTVTSTYPLVYHGAGTNNQFFGFSVCPTGRTSTGAAAIQMEAAANAISTTCTVTSGSADVVVASASGINALMCASIPGFPAGSVVANVVGTTVTMFGTATSSHAAGTACSFGAQSNALQFDGLTSPGTSGKTYCIETKGNVSVTLSGRTTFTDHIAAIRSYGNDVITLNGSASYFDCPVRWVLHPSDDSGVASSEDKVIRAQVNAGLNVLAAGSSSARQASLQRGDQSHPNMVLYPGAMFLSDGTFDPTSTGVSYLHDTADGLDYVQLFLQAQTQFLKVTGASGATVDARYFGRFAATGAPTSGTWRVGDWIIDQNGTVWACTAAGTPGTWSAGAAPSYAALSYPANAAPNVLGAGHFQPGVGIDTQHHVVARGLVKFTAAFAAGAVLCTVPVGYRPASLLVAQMGLKYDSVGAFSAAPMVFNSDGTVTSAVAFATNDSVFIDGCNWHAA